jgi:hypothetical protein
VEVAPIHFPGGAKDERYLELVEQVAFVRCGSRYCSLSKYFDA